MANPSNHPRCIVRVLLCACLGFYSQVAWATDPVYSYSLPLNSSSSPLYGEMVIASDPDTVYNADAPLASINAFLWGIHKNTDRLEWGFTNKFMPGWIQLQDILVNKIPDIATNTANLDANFSDFQSAFSSMAFDVEVTKENVGVIASDVADIKAYFLDHTTEAAPAPDLLDSESVLTKMNSDSETGRSQINDRVASVGGLTGQAASGAYAVRNQIASDFQLSDNPGGAAWTLSVVGTEYTVQFPTVACASSIKAALRIMVYLGLLWMIFSKIRETIGAF